MSFRLADVRKLPIAVVLLLVIAPSVSSHAAEPQKPNTLTAEEIADGWILLFDGTTMFGWEPASKANWSVADGAIRVSEGEKGLLNTSVSWSDFVLKVDFRAPLKTNSGVFLRTAPVPKDPKVDCYELNIAHPSISPFPTGSFVGRKKADGEFDTSEWRTFTVRAEKGHFVVQLDGKQVLEYDDPKPLGRGPIGLQFNEGLVEFRNVKLKPLDLKSIFNGKDLSGWHVIPGHKSEFSVTPAGELSVKDGNGGLESDGKWGDFVLQLDVKTLGKNLNSGIFFRSIPGDFNNGYESQIHNGYKDGDRTQPIDYGTGAIYRRVKARRVVSDDLTWVTKTVVADGPRLAVWVNGFPVTDWLDTRKLDNNPRNGLRLEAGTLIIQGHDPTTDLLFRNMKIAESPAR